MATEQTVALVQAWVAAANNQDREGLLVLSAPQIALVGPHGIGYGHQLLCDWLERAGLTLTTQRIFVRNHHVVLAQHGVWRNLTDNTVLGEADVATFFQVDQALVSHFARYNDLATALTAAGLTEVDEVTKLEA